MSDNFLFLLIIGALLLMLAGWHLHLNEIEEQHRVRREREK